MRWKRLKGQWTQRLNMSKDLNGELFSQADSGDKYAQDLVGGTNGDAKKILDKLSKNHDARTNAFNIGERPGRSQPTKIIFRDTQPNRLWLWFELYIPPTPEDQEILNIAVDSWYTVGVLGGFNSMNMQVSDKASANQSLTDYDSDTAEDTLTSFMHAKSKLEVKETWARLCVDIGTADEICQDILVNMILAMNTEYLKIKTFIIGGENQDWTVPHFAPDEEEKLFGDVAGASDPFGYISKLEQEQEKTAPKKKSLF